MLKNNIYKIMLIITTLITVCALFYFIDKKEGFHEDEIFSYGSSNYMYDNLFQIGGDMSVFNEAFDITIESTNIVEKISKSITVIFDRTELESNEAIIEATNSAVWKTNEDTTNYLTINSLENALNYIAVYWNQSVDVHPPLFYFLVHTISIFVYRSI